MGTLLFKSESSTIGVMVYDQSPGMITVLANGMDVIVTNAGGRGEWRCRCAQLRGRNEGIVAVVEHLKGP